MSLTLPTNYSNALANQFRENLLVRLYYDDSNYTAIALYDHTVSSVAHTGCILNNPSFRENIKLEKGTASSSNISLDCADATFGSDKLSALLINGSNTYLTRKVEIYSILNDSSNIADAVKIYTGRLQSVTMDDARVKLNIVARLPWDMVELPNTKADNGVYIPVAYGDFTANGTTGLSTSKSLYPAPFTSSAGNQLFFLTANSILSSAAANYYDSNAGMFINLAHNTATTTQDGKDALGVGDQIIRTYRLRPNGTAASGNQWTNPENSYDTSKVTYATATAVSDTDGGVPVSTDLKITLPNISGKITAMILYIKADVTFAGAVPGVTGTVSIAENSYGQGATIISGTSGTTSTSGYADPDGSGSDYSRVILTGNAASNDDQLPDSITIQVISDADDDGYGYDLTATGKIYDIYLQITSQNNESDEPQATAKERADLDTVYIGNDGLSSNSSWSGDSNALTKVHEFHRDFLHRYLGITDSPTNWSALDTAKSSWTGRYWETEPTAAKKILEQLQYEGGFIFLFSQETPKYVFIPDSISADHTLTKSDITNLKIGHTGVGDLVTKMEIGYDRHPAENKYESSYTYTSGERSDYDFAANENVAQIDLDALVGAVSGGSNRNDSFEKYYDSITGNLKTIVSCDVVDPTIGGLIEMGDFVQFTNGSMDTKPFGDAWTSKDFIITSVTRKVGVQVKIKCREC